MSASCATSQSPGPVLADHGARFGVPALVAEFPGLALAPDSTDQQFRREDEVRVVGHLAFTTLEQEDRPSLTWSYEIKIIAPRTFPSQLPRIFSIDGQVPENYHTNPAKDLCLGPSLQLHEILREDPTLLGYVTGTVVPFLYRHRFTVLYPNADPPRWGELAHGTPGLLTYYGDRLGVTDYGACLALLRPAAQRQQKKGRKEECPCGSGRTLFECHYKQMVELRKSVGRGVLRQALTELQRSGPPQSS